MENQLQSSTFMIMSVNKITNLSRFHAFDIENNNLEKIKRILTLDDYWVLINLKQRVNN